MPVGVFDPHEHGVGQRVHRRRPAALDDDDGAVSEDELCAMVTDPESFTKPEGAAKPFACLRDVGVSKLRDDGHARNRSVLNHLDILI
jgi:hypothetical protein